MTEIRYQANGEQIRISVVGHALYNPGDDIVCAGISAITCQMLNVLSFMDERDKISECVIDMNDGSVIVSFKVKPEHADEWETVWRVIWCGYAQIEQEYPENVHID